MSKKIYKLFIVLALITFLYCILKQYGGLPVYLLPLSYAISLIICKNLKDKFASLSVAIINAVCFIRCVIYPLMLVLENSAGTYYTYICSDAIYLTAYEILAVQIFLNFYSKRLDSQGRFCSDNFMNSTLGPCNKLLLILVVPIGILFPSLFSFFRFLGIQRGASVPGVIAVFFEMGVTVAYVYLLSVFSKKRNYVSLLISIAIALGYIFITMVSGENVRRWLFLWTGIPTTVVLINAYPRYKNTIRTFALIVIPAGIFFGSFVKFAVSSISLFDFFTNFLSSEMLSEYFGGLNGVTYAMTNLAYDANATSFTSTLTDLFGNMPVVSRFFNVDAFSTQVIYLEQIGRHDLICPLLGQSYTHFGTFGAPLLSIIMTAIAVECDASSKKAQTLYELYVLIMMCVIFSLFMCLNTMIILTHAWTLIILLLVQYYNNKILSKNEKTFNNSSNI